MAAVGPSIPIHFAARHWLTGPCVTRWLREFYSILISVCRAPCIGEHGDPVGLCKCGFVKVHMQAPERNQQMGIVAGSAFPRSRKQLLERNARVGTYMSHQQIFCSRRYRCSVVTEVIFKELNVSLIYPINVA